MAPIFVDGEHKNSNGRAWAHSRHCTGRANIVEIDAQHIGAEVMIRDVLTIIIAKPLINRYIGFTAGTIELGRIAR